MATEKSRPGFASLVGRPLLAGAVAVAAVAPIDAEADIFLKLSGIDGESADDKHKGEIDVLSYSQAFKSTATIGGGGTGTGKVSCGAVTIVKQIDRASPALIRAAVLGRFIPKATITFRSGGGASAFEYYTVVLNQALVTEIDQADSSDPSRIIERVVLTPSKFEFTYTPQKSDGTRDAEVRASFDCTANKAG